MFCSSQGSLSPTPGRRNRPRSASKSKRKASPDKHRRGRSPAHKPAVRRISRTACASSDIDASGRPVAPLTCTQPRVCLRSPEPAHDCAQPKDQTPLLSCPHRLLCCATEGSRALHALQLRGEGPAPSGWQGAPRRRPAAQHHRHAAADEPRRAEPAALADCGLGRQGDDRAGHAAVF